jgi:alanyl-tRNA synthetase
MGALMKEAMATLGSRGGGNRDMAQGGAPDASRLAEIIEQSTAKIRSEN